MAEVIVFPDAENAVRRHLIAAFAARPGFTTVTATTGVKPSSFPTEFVHVTRTGGPSEGLVIDRPQITLESYAKTSGRAVAVAQMALALLHAAVREGKVDGFTVYGMTEFSGPYADPDPNSLSHTRYSATIQLAVRGNAA